MSGGVRELAISPTPILPTHPHPLHIVSPPIYVGDSRELELSVSFPKVAQALMSWQQVKF